MKTTKDNAEKGGDTGEARPLAERRCPVGTRIVFIKTLACGPIEEHPALLYARKGEKGTVVGHNAFEGHMVKRDNWPHSFGAIYGGEFDKWAPESGGDASGEAVSPRSDSANSELNNPEVH